MIHFRRRQTFIILLNNQSNSTDGDFRINYTQEPSKTHDEQRQQFIIDIHNHKNNHPLTNGWGYSMMNESTACCGLFCESCGVYIATKKNNDIELERIAKMMGTTKDEIRCEGCRSSVLSPHCRNCEYRTCADNKRIENCEQCGEFPCDALKSFQKQMPHRAELFESAGFRRDNGIVAWRDKMKRDYSCESCGAINSPYYTKCAKCGNEPANDFRERNISLFRK